TAADMDRPLPTANAELARQNDQVALQYVARLEKPSTATSVQRVLLEMLPDGPPSKAAVARRLGMSPRSLQRHLDEESTSYKEVLNAARAALARGYVAERRFSTTEIAFMLGFADTASFSRAFKRWTGMSARQYGTRAASGAPPSASTRAMPTKEALA